MTHLILHKVRGEPAFDIAEKIQIGDEEGWIIPTSGHRAYPYWHTKIDEWDFLEYSGAEKALKEIPDDWPDHYQCNDKPSKTAPTGRLTEILSMIGIYSPKINRRGL